MPTMKLYNTFLVFFFPAAFLSIALCFCFHIPSLTFSNIINFTSYDNIKYLYNYYVNFSPNNSELQELPKRFSNTDIDNIKELHEDISQDFDRRTLGVGGQILSDLGVTKMKLLSSPKTFYGLGGYGLEIEKYITE